MQIVILKDAAEVARYGAQIFVDQINKKADSVIGLATGSTPVALYQDLIARNKANEVSFATVTSFNLDEYLGLTGDHPQSYRFFMNEQLFNHVDITQQSLRQQITRNITIGWILRIIKHQIRKRLKKK